MSTAIRDRVEALLSRWPRLTAALAVGLVAPILLVAAFAVMLVSVWALQSVVPTAASFSLWLCAIVPALLAVPLWLLVSRSLVHGGWYGVLGGLAVIAGLAGAFFVLGDLEQALDPSNSMAGLGSDLLAIALVVLLVVVAVLAAADRAIRRVRSGGGQRPTYYQEHIIVYIFHYSIHYKTPLCQGMRKLFHALLNNKCIER